MKHLTILLATALATVAPAFSQKPLPAPAKLIYDDIEFENVWLTAASSTNLQYKRSEFGQSQERIPREEVQTIYFLKPETFITALDLFKLEKYDEAYKEFEKCKKAYSRLNNLPNNYSTQAAFYQLECLRLQGKLTELAAQRLEFNTAGLTRPDQKQQLNVYRIWEQVAAEDWGSLSRGGRERILATKIPGHRVQVAYCTGLGQMNMLKPFEALKSFSVVMTADGGASTELAQKAALASLDIFLADEVTMRAQELESSQSEDFNPQSTGAIRLAQAGAIVSVWNTTFGVGIEIPEKYDVFKRYGSAN